MKAMFKLSKAPTLEEVAGHREKAQQERARLTARQAEIEREIAQHYGEDITTLGNEYNTNLAQLKALDHVEQSLTGAIRDAMKNDLIVWYERQCIDERTAVDGLDELTPQIEEAQTTLNKLMAQAAELQATRRNTQVGRTLNLTQRVDTEFGGDRTLLAEIDGDLSAIRAKYKLE